MSSVTTPITAHRVALLLLLCTTLLAQAQTAPWVTNLSKPYRLTHALQGTHLAVYASHGRYYSQEQQQWQWQRPRLFATCEDLFTQSFVTPFLIPMLENAGAVVFTARERDWQPQCVVVDNDFFTTQSLYYEHSTRRNRWLSTPQGFAHRTQNYKDGENPFTMGTARYVASTTKRRKKRTYAQWMPNIPATGTYAVYVSYQTLPHSVHDAHYTVYHAGGATEFAVNQQMGGGTWVYLGTFTFLKGSRQQGMVQLTNQSSKRGGVVCADAVRFGGGMGSVERGGTTSQMPRYMEGARYYAQWSGMPYEVYGDYQGANDYADDINTRSLLTNYLAGSSPRNPYQKGLAVPLALQLSIHSDAGFSTQDELIGSLGICTTTHNGGKLGDGSSRQVSKQLAEMVLEGVQHDLSATYGIVWPTRGVWDKNYSETRLPQVPSMILEMLSHQNYADMCYGHHPLFKFTLCRAVYKSILRYLCTQEQRSYVVQPLPVHAFAVQLTHNYGTVELTWQPTTDPLEPTATPTSYVVYTQRGDNGFDNGVVVTENRCQISLETGVIYGFQVCALNSGGESFPSETLSAYLAPKHNGNLLIVNGFNRLSAPANINTSTQQGFDLSQDIGVPYHNTLAFCGNQLYFDRSQMGSEKVGGLGYSGSELEGYRVAGNTANYPHLHGKAIAAAGGWSYVSCSKEALANGTVDTTPYKVIDLLLGTQEMPFEPADQQWIGNYLRRGGNLFVSGAHIAAPTTNPFTAHWLKYVAADSTTPSLTEEVFGLGNTFAIHRAANTLTYAVPHVSQLTPTDSAFISFIYTDTQMGAGIAYRGNYRTFVLGFPFESIQQPSVQNRLMASILHFFQ